MYPLELCVLKLKLSSPSNINSPGEQHMINIQVMNIYEHYMYPIITSLLSLYGWSSMYIP